MIKEACVGSFNEAKIAIINGANRVELCENLEVGGTTPSYGMIKKCIKDLEVPTLVMIRPRGGDFNYSIDEIEIMKEDILNCKKLGVVGVVFGVLKADNTVDYELLKELVEISKPMEITFHKAIDEVENPVKEIEKFIELGITRILTSGKKDTALEGQLLLNEMLKASQNKIKIVVAGKVTKDNLETISQNIPSSEFHGKRIV
ncbi:MAG: copper homeostasis protein CutC [Fusobacteriaceae bacterium]